MPTSGWHLRCGGRGVTSLSSSCGGYGGRPAPLHAVQPASAARDLALEHGFITLMPELAIKRDLEVGRLVRLDVRNLPQEHWDVMMAWRGGKRPNPARETVLATARTLAKRWRNE